MCGKEKETRELQMDDDVYSGGERVTGRAALRVAPSLSLE
jgi:hypothetical protein